MHPLREKYKCEPSNKRCQRLRSCFFQDIFFTKSYFVAILSLLVKTISACEQPMPFGIWNSPSERQCCFKDKCVPGCFFQGDGSVFPHLQKLIFALLSDPFRDARLMNNEKCGEAEIPAILSSFNQGSDNGGLRRAPPTLQAGSRIPAWERKTNAVRQKSRKSSHPLIRVRTMTVGCAALRPPYDSKVTQQ